jgi:hypothetical protein
MPRFHGASAAEIEKGRANREAIALRGIPVIWPFGPFEPFELRDSHK